MYEKEFFMNNKVNAHHAYKTLLDKPQSYHVIWND